MCAYTYSYIYIYVCMNCLHFCTKTLRENKWEKKLMFTIVIIICGSNGEKVSSCHCIPFVCSFVYLFEICLQSLLKYLIFVFIIFLFRYVFNKKKTKKKTWKKVVCFIPSMTIRSWHFAKLLNVSMRTEWFCRVQNW